MWLNFPCFKDVVNMLQFHKHLLTFGVFCGVAGLSYVLPLVAVICVVIGVCTLVYANNVNILAVSPTSSLKARFSVFRCWLEYIQMKGYQLSKPVEEKVRSRNASYSKENSPHISISHRLSFPRSRYACPDDSSNSANRRNGFSRYSLSQVNSSFDTSSRLENQYGNVSKTQNSTNSFRDEKTNLSRLSSWNGSENSLRERNRTKTVQTLAGPLLSSARLNRSNSFDLGLFVDAGSPGLATRVVQYAEDSGFVGKVTHQSQYSAPGQFPRVHLSRSHSKLPVLSPRNSQKVARRSVNLRIASPEQHGSGSRLFLHSSRSSNLHSSPPPAQMDPSTKSLLETLREISRKRMHSQLDDDDDDDAKRQKKTELESSSSSSSLPNGAIIDNDLQSKRSREDSPKQVDNQTQRPSKRFRNNEILSSLSSSRKLLQTGGIKRKTHSLDWSRSSTPVFGKLLKTSELSPPAVSVPGHNNVSPTSVAVVKGISPNVTNEIEIPKPPSDPKNKIYTSPEKPGLKMTHKESPEVTAPVKQMLVSQNSKLKVTLEVEKRPSEELACVLEDLHSLEDRYPGTGQCKLTNMLSSLSDGEDVPLTRAAVEPLKEVGILSTTSTPAACLSTATCTTSVLPTISSSSAEATKLMTSGTIVSSPTQSFSGFGSGSNTSITNNFSSSQPVPSVSLSEGMTRGSNPTTVASSQASVDTSKSQLTNSQSPFNSVSVSNNTTPVQLGFGSSASASTAAAAASQDTQRATTGANFGFIPTSLQQTKGADVNTPSSSTSSTFGFSGNTTTNKPTTSSASGFGIANSLDFGSTSGGFNFASPTVTAQSTSSAAAAPFSVQQATSSSSAENSSVVKGSSVFTSPTSVQQSQGTTITSSFAPMSTVQNTSGTGSALFSSSSASSQINKSFSFGSGSATSPVQQTGSGSSIFGSTVTSTPVQQTNTSTVSNAQNSAFGSAPNCQPAKQGGFSFGNSSATSATSIGQAEGKTGGFAFGGTPAFSTSGTCQDQPKTFGFGTQSTPVSSSFGTQQTPASISFGTQQTPVSSSFGTQQTPASSSFSTQQTQASSSFHTQQTPASSSFGTPRSPANSSFGTQQTPVRSSFGTQQTPASSSFGTQQTPASSSTSLFGAQGDNSSAMGGFSFLSKQNSATPNNGSVTTSPFQLGQAGATTTNQNPAGGFNFGFANSSKPASTTSSSASSGFGSMFSSSSANSATPTGSQQVQFGSSAPTDKPMFSFGSSNKPSTFGAVGGAPATNAPQSSSGGFGSPFGSSAASTPSAAESQQKSQGMFSFGSGPGFGAGNTSTNTFSFGSSAEKKEGGFAFGSTSQQPANSGGAFNFNAGSSATAPTTHNFSSGGMFGAQQPQAASFSFGAGSSGTTGSGGFSFGAQNSSAPAFGAGSAGTQNSSTFGTGPSSGIQNTSTPAFGGGLSAGASSGSTPGFGAGPSGSNLFQTGSSSSGFGGAAMFSIGSGSTAPRATRSSGTRTRRTK